MDWSDSLRRNGKGGVQTTGLAVIITFEWLIYKEVLE
jgi:hypothetical protein